MNHKNEYMQFDFDKETEEDVKFQYITPAIQNAGWSNDKFNQIYLLQW